MLIEKLPSHEEIFRILSEDGELSFIIERKHKKRFYNLINRSHKLEMLFKKSRTSLNIIKTYIYGIYVGLLQITLTSSSKSLRNAVNIYKVIWRHISGIDGKDISDKEIMVTYIGKT